MSALTGPCWTAFRSVHGRPTSSLSIAGLDLAIHDGLQRQNQYGLRRRSRIMDARVKPAHDAESVVHTIGA